MYTQSRGWYILEKQFRLRWFAYWIKILQSTGYTTPCVSFILQSAETHIPTLSEIGRLSYLDSLKLCPRHAEYQQLFGPSRQQALHSSCVASACWTPWAQLTLMRCSGDIPKSDIEPSTLCATSLLIHAHTHTQSYDFSESVRGYASVDNAKHLYGMHEPGYCSKRAEERERERVMNKQQYTVNKSAIDLFFIHQIPGFFNGSTQFFMIFATPSGSCCNCRCFLARGARVLSSCCGATGIGYSTAWRDHH